MLKAYSPRLSLLKSHRIYAGRKLLLYILLKETNKSLFSALLFYPLKLYWMFALMYFIARWKVLCNVCFVYLCKTCNYEGQCHEILRGLPSVSAKMLGVAAVKADCSGVGLKFLYLHSIWHRQNMANSIFRLHTWGEILALLQSKPDSLLLSVITIVNLLP